MNKKTLIIVASIILAIVILTVGIFLTLNNFGKVKISLDSKTALKGDNVSFSISIDKNPGLYYGRIIVNYDPNVLSFISCANGDVFDECEVNNLDGQLVLLVNQSMSVLENTNKDGKIAKLNFKINDNAVSGVYNIDFDINQDIPYESTCFVDISNDESFIEFDYENGKLTVK